MRGLEIVADFLAIALVFRVSPAFAIGFVVGNVLLASQRSGQILFTTKGALGGAYFHWSQDAGRNIRTAHTHLFILRNHPGILGASYRTIVNVPSKRRGRTRSRSS